MTISFPGFGEFSAIILLNIFFIPLACTSSSSMPVIYRVFCLFVYFGFAVLGLELRALCLLGKQTCL
jgi:hypothetical protein